MKYILGIAAICGLLLTQPAKAIEMDDTMSTTRSRAAEKVERVIPLQWMAENMVDDYSKRLLPVNHMVLSNFLMARMDWQKLKDQNVRNLSERYSTSELDYMSGQYLMHINGHAANANPVLLPGTKQAIRDEMDRVTKEFEITYYTHLTGNNLSAQSFLENQAKAGVYYSAVPMAYAYTYVYQPQPYQYRYLGNPSRR